MGSEMCIRDRYERSIVPGDYNTMIKKPIDSEVLAYSIGAVDDLGDWLYVKNWRIDLLA